MARRLTCVPSLEATNMTNISHSTNQEIHGSIPCTFIFFSFHIFFFNFSGIRDRRDTMRLHYSVTEGYLLLLTST